MKRPRLHFVFPGTISSKTVPNQCMSPETTFNQHTTFFESIERIIQHLTFYFRNNRATRYHTRASFTYAIHVMMRSSFDRI